MDGTFVQQTDFLINYLPNVALVGKVTCLNKRVIYTQAKKPYFYCSCNILPPEAIRSSKSKSNLFRIYIEYIFYWI